LDFLARAAGGSRLAFTYVRKDFLEGKDHYDQENLYQRYVLKERIWRFGLDPQNVAIFVNSYGWRIIEHPDPLELAERYIKPTSRALACMPVKRLVLAEKI
jgi:O-methyltransferase involved in polyketide biosynthesis